jgi:threonine dehydratase
MADSLSLDAICAARERIGPALRRTPVIAAHPAVQKVTDAPLLLKLECLQVTGSFKPRGALAKATLFPKGSIRGLITASGGNHGLGVAYAAQREGLPSVVYLPTSAPDDKAQKLRSLGADVRIHGAVWDESNEAALAAAAEEDLAYIHAFADPEVAAGQGTLGLEILEDAPDIDTLVVAIGGGGLIAGVASAAKALKPGLRIIGVEPIGAPRPTTPAAKPANWSRWMPSRRRLAACRPDGVNPSTSTSSRTSSMTSHWSATTKCARPPAGSGRSSASARNWPGLRASRQ